MPSVRWLALALAGLLPAALSPVPTATIRVTPLVTEGRVSASFSATEAFGEDAHAVVQSGLLLTFTFDVELRRPSAIWLDHTLASLVTASTAKLDTLTGMYQVSKLIDANVVWSGRTSEEAQVKSWMTEFAGVRLEPSDRLQPNGEYYIRVRLHAAPRRFFSLWPWGQDDGMGRAAFTFIR